MVMMRVNINSIVFLKCSSHKSPMSMYPTNMIILLIVSKYVCFLKSALDFLFITNYS